MIEEQNSIVSSSVLNIEFPSFCFFNYETSQYITLVELERSNGLSALRTLLSGSTYVNPVQIPIGHVKENRELLRCDNLC